MPKLACVESSGLWERFQRWPRGRCPHHATPQGLRARQTAPLTPTRSASPFTSIVSRTPMLAKAAAAGRAGQGVDLRAALHQRSPAVVGCRPAVLARDVGPSLPAKEHVAEVEGGSG